MKENPYSNLIEIMQKQGSSSNPPSIQIGIVVDPPPNLIIKVNDLEIDKNNILISDYLLKGYKQKITIPETIATGRTSEAGEHSHSHSVNRIGIVDAEITLVDALKVGDKLVVLPTSDMQTYIIIARVVSL